MVASPAIGPILVEILCNTDAGVLAVIYPDIYMGMST